MLSVYRAILLAGFVLGSLSIFFFFLGTNIAQEKKGDKAITVHRRLVLVSPPKGHIKVKVGEMLQFQSLFFPIIPKNIGARMKVELSQGQVLELIGETGALTTTDGKQDGKAGRVAFLYVRGVGNTKVTITVRDQDGKKIDGYDAEYTVEADSR